MFKTPKPPKPPAQLPPVLGETTSALVRNRIKRRLQGLRGSRSTLLTSGSATPTPGPKKSLLGS